MRLTRFSLLTLGASSLGLSVPMFAFAALWDPIVPKSGACACPGSNGAVDWGCIIEIVQHVINIGIALAIIGVVLVIAYAGFIFMTSAANPEARNRGKTLITNALVGLLVMLAAWLVVDFIMKAIYNPDATFSGQHLGPWNSILAPTGEDFCIQVNDKAGGSIIGGIASLFTLNLGSSNSAATGVNFSGTGACDPSKVQAAAQAGGYNISTSEANVLACLAKPESTCGAGTTGAKTSAGKSTSASGPWQLLLGASDKCHSLTIPACGNLNCSAAYKGGKPKSDPASQELAAKCQLAINNMSCAAAASACLVQANNGYGAWTGTGDGYSHAEQKGCVSKYGT